MSVAPPMSIGGSSNNANNYAQILCCQCGIPMITPNAVNTCATCLASQAEITKGIRTEATLHQCRGCQRWHQQTNKWIACELESRQLMALCLANVGGLNNKGQRLVDASWIWTEPHSMRLKVRLTIQRQVESGVILQQAFVVTFIVRNQQCVECQAEFRQGSWKSLVQVRQRVSHKRTFLYLEQLILKHGAHRGCLQIKAFRDGMDFYFPDKGKAARFISFLESVCPIKTKVSKKLISTDDKNNLSNFKYTTYVEICPLCKDDLMFLPTKLARNLGNISRLALVKNISNVITLIDPLTGQTATLESDVYWRYNSAELRPIITAARSRWTKYMILGKEPVYLRPNASKRQPNRKQRTKLANLTLAQEENLGVSDTPLLHEQSHLGYLFKSGDVCVAYDLRELQLVDDEAEEWRVQNKMPDVVVVRKLYGSNAVMTEATKKRIWQLQRLDVDMTDAIPTSNRKAKMQAEQDDDDEEDFMQEVEADKDMRVNINLYKSEYLQKKKQENVIVDEDDVDNDDEEDEDDQKVQLDELLDGLCLDAGPDAQDVGDVEEFERLLVDGEKAAQDGIKYVSREEARNIAARDAATAVTGTIMGSDIRSMLNKK